MTSALDAETPRSDWEGCLKPGRVSRVDVYIGNAGEDEEQQVIPSG